MVSINTVYQKVLAFANKEQRGYITPQEFNLFADQAQDEIFEQYFYDLNQYSRNPEGSEEYSNIVSNINEKIVPFEKNSGMQLGAISTDGSYQIAVLPTTDFYRLGTVISNGTIEVEEVQQNEILYINGSPLTKPTATRPVFVRVRTNRVHLYPSIQDPAVGSTGTHSCNYIVKPLKPNWGYIVLDGKAMFDSINSSNFELHPSEENELVYKILKFAGIAIKNEYIAKAGATLEQAQTQQEKQ